MQPRLLLRWAFGPVLAFAAIAAAQQAPPVSATSAIVVDGQSGQVLFEKDADTPRFPASTTKILTAMLLIERCVPTDIITAPKDIDKIGGASLHLKPGEQMTALDLLHAIMLRSANDGCVAAAVHISGSVPAFVKEMNARAKQLGCTGTTFNNPNGLNDPLHKTTARDLATMARAAMQYPLFREVVKKRRYTIQRSMQKQDVLLVSKNKYLNEDASADGIKTGWTVPAGQCYVGSATRDGRQVITVVLASEHWKDDHASLLNWAFEAFDQHQLLAAGQTLKKSPVRGGKEKEVELVAGESLSFLAHNTNLNADVQWKLEQPLVAPLKAGQVVGTGTASYAGTIQTFTVRVKQDVAALNIARRWTTLLLVCGLGSGAYYLNVRPRRRYARKKKNPRS